MTAQAITGGPRQPGETLLQRIERWMRQTPAADPRTTSGIVFYAVIGIAIGFWLGVH